MKNHTLFAMLAAIWGGIAIGVGSWILGGLALIALGVSLLIYAHDMIRYDQQKRTMNEKTMEMPTIFKSKAEQVEENKIE